MLVGAAPGHITEMVRALISKPVAPEFHRSSAPGPGPEPGIDWQGCKSRILRPPPPQVKARGRRARPWWACTLPSLWLLRQVGPRALPAPPQTSSGSLGPLSSCSKVALGLSQGSGPPRRPALLTVPPQHVSPPHLLCGLTVGSVSLWFPAIAPEPRTLLDSWYIPGPSWVVP